MREWEERENCVEGEVCGVVIVKPAGCKNEKTYMYMYVFISKLGFSERCPHFSGVVELEAVTLKCNLDSQA